MAKVMISLPDDFLAEMDRTAARRGTTRSGFVREAVSRELERPDPELIDAALERGRAAFAGLGRFDSAELIRRDRDDRD